MFTDIGPCCPGTRKGRTIGEDSPVYDCHHDWKRDDGGVEKGVAELKRSPPSIKR